MRIEERNVGDVVMVKIHGDIVVDGPGPAAAERVRALLDQNHQRIVLDLGALLNVFECCETEREVIESFTDETVAPRA